MKFNKTLIIPCKEEGENFTTILKRFEENIKNDTEIIIVLDSVEDSTYKFIENAETKAKMIINPKDGVASAINFGIESAEGKFYLYCMRGWSKRSSGLKIFLCSLKEVYLLL